MRLATYLLWGSWTLDKNDFDGRNPKIFCIKPTQSQPKPDDGGSIQLGGWGYGQGLHYFEKRPQY